MRFCGNVGWDVDRGIGARVYRDISGEAGTENAGGADL